MGQRASAKPLVDGFCARCGEWLYGALNQCALGGNKHSGEPRDAAGNPCGADQQPPFLLRYSPKKLAEEAPAVFEWSEETNCLALRPEFQARPPWKIRSGTRATRKEPSRVALLRRLPRVALRGRPAGARTAPRRGQRAQDGAGPEVPSPGRGPRTSPASRGTGARTRDGWP